MKWPDTWDQLTSITRLEVNWRTPEESPIVYFVPVVKIESLIDVTIIMHYDLFDKSGEEYISSVIGSLPLLSRLQVAIDVLTIAKSAGSAAGCRAAEKAFRERERVKAICIAVQSSTSGVEYSIEEVNSMFFGMCCSQLEFALQS